MSSAAAESETAFTLGFGFPDAELHEGARPESAWPIPLDNVARSLAELPPLARSMAEGSGHYVNHMFLAVLTNI